MPGIEIFFFWLVMGFGISTMQLPWTSGSGNIRLWYITVDAGYSCRDIAFVRILGYRYGLRGWRMPCCSVQVRRSMYTDMVPSAARKVEMEIIDERWRSVCSKSNSQSQSSTEQTVQRTATRVQDCEINPVRPTEPQEPQWKKRFDETTSVSFSSASAGSWSVACGRTRFTFQSGWMCGSGFLYLYHYSVCEEPDFPVSHGRTAVDHVNFQQSLCVFPENSNHWIEPCVFLLVALAIALAIAGRLQILQPYGAPKAKQTDRDHPVHVPERSGFYDRRDCDLRLRAGLWLGWFRWNRRDLIILCCSITMGLCVLCVTMPRIIDPVVLLEHRIITVDQ